MSQVPSFSARDLWNLSHDRSFQTFLNLPNGYFSLEGDLRLRTDEEKREIDRAFATIQNISKIFKKQNPNNYPPSQALLNKIRAKNSQTFIYKLDQIIQRLTRIRESQISRPAPEENKRSSLDQKENAKVPILYPNIKWNIPSDQAVSIKCLTTQGDKKYLIEQVSTKEGTVCYFTETTEAYDLPHVLADKLPLKNYEECAQNNVIVNEVLQADPSSPST